MARIEIHGTDKKPGFYLRGVAIPDVISSELISDKKNKILTIKIRIDEMAGFNFSDKSYVGIFLNEDDDEEK